MKDEELICAITGKHGEKKIEIKTRNNNTIGYFQLEADLTSIRIICDDCGKVLYERRLKNDDDFIGITHLELASHPEPDILIFPLVPVPYCF